MSIGSSKLPLYAVGCCLAMWMSCITELGEGNPTPSYSAFGLADYETAKQELGEYADIFASSDGSMMFRGTTFSDGRSELARTNEYLVSYVNPQSQHYEDGGHYSLGDFQQIYAVNQGVTQAGYIRSSFPSEGVENADMEVLYGTESFFRNTGLDSAWNFEVPIHIPHRLHASIDSEFRDSAGMSLVTANVTSLTWNADRDNQNGVVAYVHWAGEILDSEINQPIPSQNSALEVHRAMLVEDAGTALLPDDLFVGIPNNALVFLYLIRGDIVHFNNAQGWHKCAALDQTQFVLHLQR